MTKFSESQSRSRRWGFLAMALMGVALALLLSASLGLGTSHAQELDPALGSPGQSVCTLHPSVLKVSESIELLPDATYRYSYQVTNNGSEAVWHFVVWTTFSAGTATQSPFDERAGWPADGHSVGAVSAPYDARNLDSSITWISHTWTPGFPFGADPIQPGETVGGFSFIGAILDLSPKLYGYEEQGSQAGTRADGCIAAVGQTVPPDEQININVVDKLSGAKLEGTCWRISYGPAKIAHDVVGDDDGGVKPDCGEPSNLKLFDKDPSAGNLRITITSAQRVQFGDIWHAQMSFEPKGNLDTFNYVCDLSQGKCEIGPVAVGGLAVDLDASLGDLPLETAQGSSGSNAGLIAGIVAAIVAGTVTLGGAGWYARRRVN